MLAVKDTVFRENLETYCDRASHDGEPVTVTRESGDSVVVMGLEQYRRMEREIRNARYLEKIDEALAQLEAGKGTAHELIEV